MEDNAGKILSAGAGMFLMIVIKYYNKITSGQNISLIKL